MSVQAISAREVFNSRRGETPPRLIDVRTPAEFAQVHAEGARSVPLDTLDPAAVMSTLGASAGAPLYVLCKSGARAAAACGKFHAGGFTNVFCVEGGTDAWERAGLPVVRGPGKVISLERQVRIAAGSLVLAGVLLGWLVHPGFYALCALIGGGLVFAGVTDWCGMGMLLARMPWNTRVAPPSDVAAACPPQAAARVSS
jgi:rhodanese-related sulfurtransferase